MEEVRAVSAPEPLRWIVVFNRRSALRWANWIPGRYKHVRAFGCVDAGTSTWIFYDVRYGRTDLFVTRGEAQTTALMAAWAEDADLVGVVPQANGNPRFRLGFWCVPAIKHLLGLRGGALLPDQLHRQCLRAGGTIFDGRPGQRDPERDGAAAAV